MRLTAEQSELLWSVIILIGFLAIFFGALPWVLKWINDYFTWVL